MTHSGSSHRPGGSCPMALGVLAFLLSLGALFVALCRDPMQPGFVIINPMGDPLSAYDVLTPQGTAKAEMQMRLKNDFRAGMEIDRRLSKKELEEKLESFKVEKEKDYKKEKDPKNKKDKGSGEYKILFVSYKQDGEDVKEIVAMEKDNDTGMWRRRFISEFDVEKKDKELAKEMRDWPGNKGIAPANKD